MKHIAYLSIFLFAVFAINLSAQAPTTTVQNIKPTVTAGDLVFAAQLLNSVELRGNEVDAFVTVKTALKPYLDKIQNEKLQATSNVEMNFPLATAQNLLTFMERGKISGADADRYKRFVDSFVTAAKTAAGQK